jgi:hypothetical protein
MEENVMPKQTASLRHAAFAAVAAASLSLSVVTLAHAQTTGDAPGAPVAAVKKHKPSHYPHYSYQHYSYPRYSHYPQNEVYQRELYGAAPYQHMFPPGMSTWPQGSPHYHGGPSPGVTFDDEQ